MGLALGGGIGLSMRAHGLVCDSILGVQLVLADGSVVTFSALSASLTSLQFSPDGVLPTALVMFLHHGSQAKSRHDHHLMSVLLSVKHKWQETVT